MAETSRKAVALDGTLLEVHRARGGGVVQHREVMRNGVVGQAEQHAVEHRAVHLALVVLEDPELRHLFHDIVDILRPITLHGAEENEQSPADAADDFAVDLDSRGRNPLDQRLHDGFCNIVRLQLSMAGSQSACNVC